jgi:O-antigen/teichoic acid export membrane protein
MTEDNVSSWEKIAGGASIALLFTVVGYILGFVFKFVMARFLGADVLGQYALLESILEVSLILCSLGLSNGVQYYLPLYEERGHQTKYWGYSYFARTSIVTAAAFLSLFLILFAEQIGAFFQFENIATDLRLIALILPVTGFNKYLRNAMLTRDQIFLERLGDRALKQGMLVVGALISFWLGYGLRGVIVAYLLSRLFPSFLYVWSCPELAFIPEKDRTYELTTWISYSTPLFITAILASAIGRVDQLIIGRFLSSTDLGIYSVILSSAKVTLALQGGFSALFLPTISREWGADNADTVNFLYRKTASWIFAITLFVITPLILYSDIALSLVYGAEYTAGSFGFIILLIGMTVNVGMGLNQDILFLMEKTKEYLFVNAASFITNIGLNLLLINSYGVTGVAIATAASMSLQQVALRSLVWKHAGIHLDWWKHAKFVLSCLIGISSAALIVPYLSSVMLKLVIGLTVYSVLTGFLLLKADVLEEEDIDILLRLEERTGIDLTQVKRFYKWIK